MGKRDKRDGEIWNRDKGIRDREIGIRFRAVVSGRRNNEGLGF